MTTGGLLYFAQDSSSEISVAYKEIYKKASTKFSVGVSHIMSKVALLASSEAASRSPFEARQ
jgi:hypothetical protein